jgi:hypothetical protein
MDVWTVVGILAIAGAVFAFLKARAYRETYVITCPDNLEPAAVKMTAFDEKLRACTRWPEMAGCAQDCLRQIESSPHDCLVQSIVARWYANRDCYFCHKPIGPIVWHERPPAVRPSDGRTREWKDIASQDLPKVFNNADAVCWPCNLVETFRREHPEQVIERKRFVEPMHTLAPTASVY